ncbi:ArsC/Spx/MgsR family protein [Flavobacterium sp.]|uniref:ArsC/Spx/MgsR family protein n=1 Tax=Flavobacterium sp. TaxID=239 RepID=UPI0035B0D959
MKILHNPRCGKSRNCLATLDENSIDYQIIKYLETPLSKEEIINLLKMLSLSPLDLVRQKEEIWVQKFKNKALTDEKIIDALVEFPILIERPILIDGNKAIIAREQEKITAFIKK